MGLYLFEEQQNRDFKTVTSGSALSSTSYSQGLITESTAQIVI
jgi:hypothetical protein